MIKNLPAKAGDTGSFPGLGRSPGVGNSNLLQYSCLENLMDRGAWQAPVQGVERQLDTTATKQQQQQKLTYDIILVSAVHPIIKIRA